MGFTDKSFVLYEKTGYFFRRGNGVIYFQKVFSTKSKREVFRCSLKTKDILIARDIVKNMVKFFNGNPVLCEDIRVYLDRLTSKDKNETTESNKIIDNYLKGFNVSDKELKFIEKVITSFVGDNQITTTLFLEKNVIKYIDNCNIKSISTLYKFVYRLDQFTNYLIENKILNITNYFSLYKKKIGKRRNVSIEQDSSIVKIIEDSSDDCYFYIQELVSPNIKALKYGIGYNPEIRMKEQEKESMFRHELVYKVHFKLRQDAKKIEDLVKSKFGGNFCKKQWMEDGYTETLPHYNYEELLAFVQKEVGIKD